MNIIILRVITNIIEMNSKLIKVWSVLFTLWKHGKYEDRVMPTTKELEKLVGLTDKPINDAIKVLQKIRVKDRYHQSFPLLRMSTKRINGSSQRVYTLAVPEYGELNDPSAFTQDGGGSATMSSLGGYFTLTVEIQKAVSSIGDQVLAAALENVASSKAYNPDLYNYKTIHTLNMMKCMSDAALRSATKRLKKEGILVVSKAEQVGKYWGWADIAIATEPNTEQTIGDESEMTKEEMAQDDDEKLRWMHSMPIIFGGRPMKDDLYEFVDDIEELDECIDDEAETEADAIEEIEEMAKDERQGDEGTVVVSPSDGMLIRTFRNEIDYNDSIIKRLKVSKRAEDVDEVLTRYKSIDRLRTAMSRVYAKYGKQYVWS